jgi:sugar phosphate isomerase/epimerase
VSLHVHDNHGAKDEHLWPGDGTIDWNETVKQLHALATAPAAVLEISYTPGDTPATVQERTQASYDLLA